MDGIEREHDQLIKIKSYRAEHFKTDFKLEYCGFL